MTMLQEPRFNQALDQYVARVNGGEVYGRTWTECQQRLMDALRAAAAHAQHNPDEMECDCVLPEQSCPACREAARAVYGGGDDPLPF